MADLVAADVTITVQKQRILAGSPGGIRMNLVKIVFGDGALTYPAAGVPLPAFSKFGFMRELESLMLTDKNDAVGLDWKYDHDNKKLRAWQTAASASTAHTHTLHFQTAAAANAVTAAANALRTPAAAFDVAGVVDSAGEGGIVNATPTVSPAAASVELGNVAVAAQTLYGYAFGW